ncbi:MAG: PSD1 domain-containing protein [Verrucomicrobia bacterium]|nr:PSD1 domain-containing protein [Verrucomicrobiota bacterium]
MSRSGLCFAACLVLAVPRGESAAAAPPAEEALPDVVQFNRHIRPIMSDTCFHCHGFDPKSRKGGLRLDLREEALKPAKSGGIPIVPGKPDESEILLRVMDTVEPMPPADAHKALTPRQKALLRRWVEQGANYEAHWAYTPLTRPPVPAVAGAVNPIDAFIRARLADKRIAPSPEAPQARLLRRLSLDLTGLPPTPEDVAAFLQDGRPGAYERQVERLLTSAHHGERLAVWWLDLARFSDTVGFHGDQNQRIFPYRDYVIAAFNANKRFDRFTIEQLAGDLLPEPTVEQRVATGYNRLNMMTREGGAQPAEYLAKYGAERVRSVAAAWFGSTFGCAECHDHKFDPITMRDFYSLQAFFADVKQWGVYADYGYTRNPDLAGFNNDYPFPPEVEVVSPYLQARQRAAEAALGRHRAEMQREAPEPQVAAWAAAARERLTAHPGGWQRPTPTAAVLRANKPLAGAAVTIGADGFVFPAKPLGRNEALQITLLPGAGRVAAVQVEVTAGPAGSPALKNAKNRGTFRLALNRRDAAGKMQKLPVALAEASASDRRYKDGEEVLGITGGWKLPALNEGEIVSGVWVLDASVEFAEGEQLVAVFSGDVALPVRVGTSFLSAGEPLQVASPALLAALPIAPERWTTAQRELVAEAWWHSAAGGEPVRRQRELYSAWRETRDGRAWSMVTESTTPLTIRVLPRGNWQDESGPVVLPATPGFLPGRRESTPEKRLTRLDLAQWIVSTENPITARAVMNRLWAMCFGIGLSAAVDDLGSQGEPPTHPELLDWLAAEFRESGWDLRHMIRLIVTSATYRQGSQARPELREVDPANRLLAAQNPRRLEVEFVRDQALAAAGALNLREIGGPSVKPYQPAGYYSQLQFPDRDYLASTGDEQWRRGVYMHWQRTFLHPMLANFDAPARDECAAQRVVSNTPQQALTLLNDPTFVEAARLLAARLLREATGDDARLRRGYLLAVSREPQPRESSALRDLLQRQREHYRENSSEAEKLLRVGYAPVPKDSNPVELAAWTQVARVLLNLQETFTRY